MNVNGEKNHGSTSGLCCTISITILAAAYAALKLIALIAYDETTYSNKILSNAIDLDSVYTYE